MSHIRGISQNKKQEQVTKKAQMVDQNYADSTLFMTLSDIETIEQKYLYSQSRPKQFGMYDPIDYSHREIDVLKEQLRLKLILVKSSLLCFQQDYGYGSYRLPGNFNKSMVIDRLKEFQKSFQKFKDVDCFRMCQDLVDMIEGRNNNFHFENSRFKNAPSVSHEENVRGLMMANSKIKQEKRDFEANYKDNMEAQDIKFRQNQGYKNNSPQITIGGIDYKNGDYYYGDLRDGAPHGKGILTTKEGKLEGIFKDSVLDGQYLFVYNNGSRERREYKYGKLTYYWKK